MVFSAISYKKWKKDNRSNEKLYDKFTGRMEVLWVIFAQEAVPAYVDYIRTAKRDKLIVIDFKTFHTKGAYKYEASAILNRIFGELHQNTCSVNRRATKIGPSLSYMEENYFKKDFSLSKAAKRTLISDTYFRKLFLRSINCFT